MADAESVTCSAWVPECAGDGAAVVPTESVALPPAVTEPGLTDAVTPAGAPVTDSVTCWAERDVTAVLTVAEAEPPGSTEADTGFAAREKSLPGTEVPPVKGLEGVAEEPRVLGECSWRRFR